MYIPYMDMVDTIKTKWGTLWDELLREEQPCLEITQKYVSMVCKLGLDQQLEQQQILQPLLNLIILYMFMVLG